MKAFFNPVNRENLDFFFPKTENRIGNNIQIYEKDFPDVEGVKIAIIGVEEERNAADNLGCGQAPDAIRKQFYRLFAQNNMPAIADLGNIKIGKTANDTYFALSEVAAQLIERGIVIIILGGSQDLTYANYLAYQQLGRTINITGIDQKFDIGDEHADIKSDSYINKIILSNPNVLFNYSNVGYQSYLVDTEEIKLMEKLLFDAHRIGIVKRDLVECEPVIRGADLVSVDMNAVRFSYAPGCNNVGPNGFSGEEICTLANYAGANDRLSSFGIYEYNPQLDIMNQSAMLISQMLWYFIQGVSLRNNDLPDIAKGNFYKYFVSILDTYQIVFYQSKTSHLWWMEIPINENNKEKISRNYIIPCSEKDYLTACNEEIPERWMQTYKKLIP